MADGQNPDQASGSGTVPPSQSEHVPASAGQSAPLPTIVPMIFLVPYIPQTSTTSSTVPVPACSEGDTHRCQKSTPKSQKPSSSLAPKGTKKKKTDRFNGRCHNCRKYGHKWTECRSRGSEAYNPSPSTAPKGTGKEKTGCFEGKCYNCQRVGHKKEDCKFRGGGAYDPTWRAKSSKGKSIGPSLESQNPNLQPPEGDPVFMP